MNEQTEKIKKREEQTGTYYYFNYRYYWKFEWDVFFYKNKGQNKIYNCRKQISKRKAKSRILINKYERQYEKYYCRKYLNIPK